MMADSDVSPCEECGERTTDAVVFAAAATDETRRLCRSCWMGRQ